jgi:hypothetical protein
MVNVEYHKGSFCVYKTKFCQEGFCSGCEIYLKKSVLAKIQDHRVCLDLHQFVQHNRQTLSL